MGTRHEDQPPEHWAGAESLDPTPVWKQYALVALLLFVGLIAVLVVSLLAIAPQIVTPPALVPGDRLVLAIGDLPAAGAPPKLIGAPLVSADREFWLVQPAKGEVYAFRRAWSYQAESGVPCTIEIMGLASVQQRSFIGHCQDGHAPTFGGRGQSFEGPAMRGLDQYLVSVSDDRLIVNLSRLVRASERTTGPVPTGIPQPQQP
jgi:hypothetical protein